MRILGSEVGWEEAGGGAGGSARRSMPPRLARTTLTGVLEAERDRWFLWIPVLFGTGIGIYFALPVEPWLIIAAGLVVAACGLIVLAGRGTLLPVVALGVLTLALGFGAAKLRADWVRAPIIAEVSGRSAPARIVRGWIERFEQQAARGDRITLRVASIEGLEPAATPVRIRVRSRFRGLSLRVGEAVTLKAVLAAPPQPAFPGGYDFARIAWFEQIGAVGYLIERPRAEPVASPPPGDLGFSVAVESMRESVGAAIRAALPGESGAVTEALITGERGAIPEEINTALQDSGLSHILAISGFNMAIMAGAVFGLVRGLLALSPALALNWPIKQIAAFAGLAGAGFCLVLSGAGSATMRAFLMIALMLLAILLGRRALSMRNLALAGLALLAVAPETLLDAGFQMSFSAVVGLMAVYEAMSDRRAAREGRAPPPARGPLRWLGALLVGTIASTAVATLAVAPFATFHFHKLAVYGLIANIAAVPLFAFVIMPLIVVVLVAMPIGLETLPLQLLGLAVDVLLAIARAVAGLDGAIIRVPAMPVLALALLVVGGIWLCLWRRRWRLLGLVPVGVGLVLASGSPRADLLIGRDGRPVAIRMPGGMLSALPGPGNGFTLDAWLEADGDGRSAKTAAQGEGFRCDDIGCTAEVGGVLVAFPDGPAALAEDCGRAGIVVLRQPLERPCPSARLVLDQQALAAHGTHAIALADGSFRLLTRAAGWGERPWSPRLAQRVPHSRGNGARPQQPQDLQSPAVP